MEQNPDDIRICFAVESQLKQRLQDKVKWGDIRSMYTVITEQLVDLLETYDPEVVKAGILSKKIPLSKLLEMQRNDDAPRST